MSVARSSGRFLLCAVSIYLIVTEVSGIPLPEPGVRIITWRPGHSSGLQGGWGGGHAGLGHGLGGHGGLGHGELGLGHGVGGHGELGGLGQGLHGHYDSHQIFHLVHPKKCEEGEELIDGECKKKQEETTETTLATNIYIVCPNGFVYWKGSCKSIQNFSPNQGQQPSGSQQQSWDVNQQAWGANQQQVWGGIQQPWDGNQQPLGANQQQAWSGIQQPWDGNQQLWGGIQQPGGIIQQSGWGGSLGGQTTLDIQPTGGNKQCQQFKVCQ